MKNIKENKGITLIALVITIIVLLLLAGISISMLSGQDGILTKAADAKSATKEKEDYEELVLAAQSALTEGLGKIDLSNDSEIQSLLGSNYNYLGEGIVEKDGEYYALQEDGTVIKGGLKVGDRITYIPPSVTDAKWSAEYSGLKESDATATDTVLDNTLDVSNENSFKVTSWRVLSIEDEKINLISENPTTGKVYLGNVNGYNNGVKLLNDVCNKLYGDARKGITGRSINIEDIEEKMTKEGLESVDAFVNLIQYREQSEKKYTENNYYPIIYANEKLSVINGVKNNKGLGVSEQNEYYTGSTQPEEAEDGTKSIQPYQTYWYKSATDMKKYLGVTNGLTTSINYELIMPKQNSTTYWVASRCIDDDGDNCDFDIRKINSGEVFAVLMSSSDNELRSSSVAIRPIVSIDTELLMYDETNKIWSIK